MLRLGLGLVCWDDYEAGYPRTALRNPNPNPNLNRRQDIHEGIPALRMKVMNPELYDAGPKID